MGNKSKIKELNLGIRKVSNMNFSKIVTLPKTFTENCLGETMQVQMTMYDGKLTLTPTNSKKEIRNE
ncbi:MAG: hypothetical protein IIA83_01765 [Thaumarchaeota archaeon]|nr:hypothetical protein [Nitrososphaerota archaeon]